MTVGHCIPQKETLCLRKINTVLWDIAFMSAYFRLTNSNLRSQAGEIHPSAHTGAIIFTTGKFQTEVKKDDSDQCYWFKCILFFFFLQKKN